MKNESLAIGGALVAAIAASLCCVGPLLFGLLGLGAFGASAAFGAARPYLLAAAALLLAFGFYRVYFRREAASGPGGECATKPVGRAGRASLWFASAAVLVFALSPYSVGHIAAALAGRQTTPPSAAAQATPDEGGQQGTRRGGELQTITIDVGGMDCSSCEMPIRSALERTPGVRGADVNYERGSARVQYDPKQTDVDRLKQAINSTGFEAK